MALMRAVTASVTWQARPWVSLNPKTAKCRNVSFSSLILTLTRVGQMILASAWNVCMHANIPPTRCVTVAGVSFSALGLGLGGTRFSVCFEV